MLNGNRELTLDLTLEEAQFLYCANDNLKAKAESGELAQIHQRCSSAEHNVEVGVAKVMDQIDRTLQQITDTEQDIYNGIQEKGVDRLRSHNDHSIFDTLSMALAFVSLENYTIVSATEHHSDTAALKELIGARAHALSAKIDILEEISEKVDNADDSAARHELRRLIAARDSFVAAYGADFSEIHGDAKVFKESVE